MEFKKILKNFNDEFKGTIFDSKIKNLTIKWKFENFPEILSKPTFISYISNSLEIDLSNSITFKLNEEIDYIRNIFEMTNNAAIKYLSDLDIVDQEALNIYQSFLLNVYSETRDYISIKLLTWIINDLLSESFNENGIEYNNDEIHNFHKEIIKLHFQKQLRKIIKFMIKKSSDKQTFSLLDQQYEFDIKQKQLLLKKMKQNSLLK